MPLTVDLSQFTPVMEWYMATAKGTNANSLNKKGGDVALRGAQFTPVATAAGISASLRKDKHLLAALTSLALKGRGVGNLKSPQFKAAMKQFEKQRKGAKKYLRSGWAPIATYFKKWTRGAASTAAEAKFSKAIASYGEKATEENLSALLVWITSQPDDDHANSAEEIANKAMQEAIDFVTADMAAYIERKLGEAWD